MATLSFNTDIYKMEYISSPQYINQNEIIYLLNKINKKNNSYYSQIVRYNLYTGEEKIILDNGFNNNHLRVCDNKVLFISNMNEPFNQVYCLDLNTSKIDRVTDSNQDIQFADWVEPNIIGIVLEIPTNFSNEFEWKDIQSNKSKEYYRINTMKYQADGTGFIDYFMKKHLCLLSLVDKQKIKIISDVEPGYGMRRFFSVHQESMTIYFEKRIDPHDDYNMDSSIYSWQKEPKLLSSITEHCKTGIFSEAAVSPNGQYIAMVGNELPYETHNQLNLYLYNNKNKKLINLSSEYGLDLQFNDNSVSDFFQNISNPMIQWMSDSSSFFVQVSEFGNVNLYQITLGASIEKISPEGWVVKEYTLLNDEILIIGSRYSKPVCILKKKIIESNWQEIKTSSERKYQEYSFSRYQEVEYASEDGGIIHGYVCFPNNYNQKFIYPTILSIHGGPYMMHSSSFYFEVEYLTANGYIVVLLNPRGSFGYGQEHTNGVYKRYGKEDYSDLMTALDSISEDFPSVDQNRLFVMGGSYGGYMTNWIVTQTDRFKAAFSERSMSNFISMFGTSDIGYHFYKDETGHDISEFNELWNASPIAYAKDVKTPLLLLHSMNDLRCPFEQAQQFYISLKHYQKDVEMVVFTDSNHELSRKGRPSQRAERLLIIKDWFDHYQ